MVRSDSGRKLWDVIPGDTLVYRFDGTSSVTAYIGPAWALRKAKLKWRRDPEMHLEEYGICSDILTLDEIRAQVPNDHIRVFVDQPFWSEWWEIGNYNEEKWIVAGKGIGYA